MEKAEYEKNVSFFDFLELAKILYDELKGHGPVALRNFLDNPNELRVACKNANMDLSERVQKSFPPVWKSIVLGAMSAEQILVAIKNSKCYVSEQILEIFNKIRVSRCKIEIDLVVLSVAELGMKDGGKLKDIYSEAGAQGFLLCSGELALLLRLLYVDQKELQYLNIAMNPIVDPGGIPLSFVIERDEIGRLCLNVFCSYEERHMDGCCRFVFIRPRQ